MGVILPAAAMSVLEILAKKRFCFSAEIIPPRNGTDFSEVFSQISQLKSAGFDFISVTHGAGGSLRGGTMPICFHAQNSFAMTAIAHLTVRGASAEDLENTLIDHHYFGIRNILALRGDPPDGVGQAFTPVAGGYSYAHELIATIKQLNQGIYKARKNYDKDADHRKGIPTEFCIGAASYPDDPPPARLEYLRKKIHAGAQFSITQMVLNPETFFTFLEDVHNQIESDFPVFPGIRIPNSYKMLNRLEKKFQISVDQQLLSAMSQVAEDNDASLELGKKWAEKFIHNCVKKNIRGIHFFIMGDPLSAITVKKTVERESLVN